MREPIKTDGTSADARDGAPPRQRAGEDRTRLHNILTGDLKVNDQWHGLLIDSINDGVAVIDTRGRFRYVNRRCAEMLDFEAEDILSRPLSDFLSEFNQYILQDHLYEQREGRNQSFEIALINRSGESIHTNVTSIPISDIEGRLDGCLAVLTDITARKRAEEELRRSEADLKAIFNNSLQYFVLLDTDMKVRAYNKVAKERARNFAGQEMRVGESILKYLLSYDNIWEEFGVISSEVLKGISFTREMKLKAATGEYYWVEVNLNPVFGEKNKVVGVCLSLININERRTAEEALKESEERYRLVVECSPDAIIIFNQDGIEFVNAAAVSLFGAESAHELMGRPALDFVAEEDRDRVGRAIREHWRTGLLSPLVERKMVRLDGTEFFGELSAIPFRVREKRSVHAVVRDISKRKHAESDLMRYQEQLRSLASRLSFSEEQERQQLATELHDRVGTTLSLSKIKLEGLRDERNRFSIDELEQVCSLIEQAIHHTRSLTLELSPPVLFELGLEAALEWLADRFQDNHGLGVHVDCEGPRIPLDEAVRNLLFRAVRELLFNVVKHADTDRTDVYVRGYDGRIRITVEDAGRGFDTSGFGNGFSQTEGFGLFSIKERLRDLGGNLEIRSAPGAGARVVLEAPWETGATPEREVIDGDPHHSGG